MENKSKIRIKIDYDRPEDNLSRLAIKLAESLSLASQYQQDAETYKAASQSEMQKANTLQNIIFQIKERKKNPPQKNSRMDPLNEYNLDDCNNEFKLLKERALYLQKKSDEYSNLSSRNRNEANKLQIKIRDINNRG